MRRRDFLQGTALAIGAGGTLSPLELMAASESASYPPALTGLRGSTPGSFEVAHALAWNGQTWPRPSGQTDDTYDLVVVGAGISGLAAAYFYRQRVGAEARILLLDNHDDFGGHARRNEFTVGGRTLLGYGGSQSIDTPGRYSVVARRLLEELAIHTDRFYEYFDADFNERFGLTSGIRFPGAHFEREVTLPGTFAWFDALTAEEQKHRISAYPVSADTRAALIRLATGELADSDVVRRMLADPERTPTPDYLRAGFGMTDEGLFLLNRRSGPLWGCGLDALSVTETVGEYMFGAAAAMAGAEAGAVLMPDTLEERDESEPYIFHFPDGNSAIARALVRTLIPGAVPGSTMEDIVHARTRYERLDLPENGVRIRLNATAVRAENRAGGVDVTYVAGGQAARVRARHAVMACYNQMVPYLCPEVGEAQREALAYPEKIPLMIVNVALANWHAIADSGLGSFYSPSGVLCNMGMDFPVSLGGYAFTGSPDEPCVLQGWHAPGCGKSGSGREQFNAGRQEIYQTPFADYERQILAELDAVWGPHGLDVARDVAGLTVNRWPHGYAYEYMDLWDPPEWDRGAGAHVTGRQQIGHISIANSDSEQYAYVNGAVDGAYRAVRELTT
ncbi:MAG: FAD-dependent oxidoreductase [Pseudomonadales bacterium]